MLSICNTNVLCSSLITKSFKIYDLHNHRECRNHSRVIGPFLFVDTGSWLPADLVTPTTLCAYTELSPLATVGISD